MLFESIYRFGKRHPILPNISFIQERFRLIEFQYESKDVLSGSATLFLFLGAIGLLALISLPANLAIIGWVTFFYAIIFSVAALFYPITIYYSQRMIDYKEEMLYAILELSNYISLDASLEYAIIQTNRNLTGVLHDQFSAILERLERKQYKTITEGLEEFIPTWLKVNVDFVKSLSLLQTAAMSPPEEREQIIYEVIDTLIVSYHQEGKRFAEALSGQTQMLISFGVIFPVMLLIMLPMASIFMPESISVPVLVFFFNITLPTLLLLLAMNFAANRVQVHTIRLEQAPQYSRIPFYFYLAPLLAAAIFLIPTVMHFFSFSQTINIQQEYAFESIMAIWTSTFGLVIAILAITYLYVQKNKHLWQEIYAVEQDLPHLLQVFTTYLSLNRSAESILGDVIDDYKHHGLTTHPVTRVFENVQEQLMRTKRTLADLIHHEFPLLVPSKRVVSVFEKIVDFTEVSQASAAKSARMVRSQVISIFKLDDYLRTLLADTLSLVYTSIAILVPLLSSAAVIMSMAIVMALTHIQEQLKGIVEAFGTKIDLSLVQTEKIIPPTIIEFIVSIYFLEMVLILSLFDSNIRYGSDKFKIAETIFRNTATAFFIYSAILISGYFFFREIVFKVLLST